MWLIIIAPVLYLLSGEVLPLSGGDAAHPANFNVSQSDISARPSLGMMIWQMSSLALAAAAATAAVVTVTRSYKYRAPVTGRGHEPTVQS